MCILKLLVCLLIIVVIVYACFEDYSTDTIQIQQDAQKRKCIEELNNMQHKIDKGMLHFESVFQNEYTTLQTFILTKRQEHNEHTKRAQDEFEEDLQTKMTQATSTMKKRIETFQKLLNE